MLVLGGGGGGVLYPVVAGLLIGVGVLLVSGVLAGLTFPGFPRGSGPSLGVAQVAVYQRDLLWVSGANLPSGAMLALASLALHISAPHQTTDRHMRLAAVAALLGWLTMLGAATTVILTLTHRNIAPQSGHHPWAFTIRSLGAPMATAVVAAGVVWWLRAHRRSGHASL